MKAFGAILIACLGIGFLVFQINHQRHREQAGQTVWFYDLHRQKLYDAPADTVPPDHDGVRAVVVAPAGQPDGRKIAYLEMFGPPLKNILDSIRLAHKSRQPYNGGVPARNSPFFETNDFVRRAGDSQWILADSPEGRQIKSEWRSWRAPDGSPLEVSPP